MTSTLNGDINELSSINGFIDIVNEFENIDTLIMGETHSIQHKEVLISNASELKKLGFNTAYLEYRPSFQIFTDMVTKGLRQSCGTPTIDYLVHGLADAKINMVCVDAEDLRIKGKSFREEDRKRNFTFQDKENTRIFALKEIKSYVLHTKNVHEAELGEFQNVMTSCFKIGPKSLENFFSFLNIAPNDKVFEKQAEFLELSKKYEQNRMDFSALFDAERNKIIASKIKRHQHSGNKSICYNGLAHITTELSALKPNETVQGFLNFKHDFETLSVGLYGGFANMTYHPEAEKIWNTDELKNFFKDNIDTVRSSDPCLLKSELREKLFYTDHYDDNDQSHEDIALHLPESIYRYQYNI